MAPIFMRAESYINRKTQQPEYTASGYYISEKFDGQRAQWDPSKQCFISRYGNIISCPEWFICHFRGLTIPIDGELFMGYGNWDLTGLFRTVHPDEDMWKKVRLILFDIADVTAGTYEVRRKSLEALFLKWNWEATGQVEVVPVRRVESRKDIEEEFKKIIALGGEGVMLNNPFRHYSDGKTSAILKYKQVMDDECVIVGYKMGNGRLSGMLGSFIVYPIVDGKPLKAREFSLAGINDSIRASYKHTHKVGTVLHYRCAELTKSGKPKHPVYLGICKKTVTNVQLITGDNCISVTEIPKLQADATPQEPVPEREGEGEPERAGAPEPELLPETPVSIVKVNESDSNVPDMKALNKGVIKISIRPRPIAKVKN
jgi:DNA ligase-1